MLRPLGRPRGAAPAAPLPPRAPPRAPPRLSPLAAAPLLSMLALLLLAAAPPPARAAGAALPVVLLDTACALACWSGASGGHGAMPIGTVASGMGAALVVQADMAQLHAVANVTVLVVSSVPLAVVTLTLGVWAVDPVSQLPTVPAMNAVYNGVSATIAVTPANVGAPQPVTFTFVTADTLAPVHGRTGPFAFMLTTSDATSSLSWVLASAQAQVHGRFSALGFATRTSAGASWRPLRASAVGQTSQLPPGSPCGSGGSSAFDAAATLVGGLPAALVVGWRDTTLVADSTALLTGWNPLSTSSANYAFVGANGDQRLAIMIRNGAAEPLKLSTLTYIMYYRSNSASWTINADFYTNARPDYPGSAGSYSTRSYVFDPPTMYGGFQNHGVAAYTPPFTGTSSAEGWPATWAIPADWPAIAPGQTVTIVFTASTGLYLQPGSRLRSTYGALTVTSWWKYAGETYQRMPWDVGVMLHGTFQQRAAADTLAPLLAANYTSVFNTTLPTQAGQVLVARAAASVGAPVNAGDAFALIFVAPPGLSLLQRVEVAVSARMPGWYRASLQLWTASETSRAPLAATAAPANPACAEASLLVSAQLNQAAALAAFPATTRPAVLAWDLNGGECLAPLAPTGTYALVVQLVAAPGPLDLIPSPLLTSATVAAVTGARNNNGSIAELVGLMQQAAPASGSGALQPGAAWSALTRFNATNASLAVRLSVMGLPPAGSAYTAGGLGLLLDTTAAGTAWAPSGGATFSPPAGAAFASLALPFDVAARGVPASLVSAGLLLQSSTPGWFAVTLQMWQAHPVTGVPTLAADNLMAPPVTRVVSFSPLMASSGDTLLAAFNLSEAAAAWPPLLGPATFALVVTVNDSSAVLSWAAAPAAAAAPTFSAYEAAAAAVASGFSARGTAALVLTTTNPMTWAPAAAPVAAYLVGRNNGAPYVGRVLYDNTASLYAIAGATLFGGPLAAPVSTAASVAFVCVSDPTQSTSITGVSFGLWVGSYGQAWWSVPLAIEFWSVDAGTLLPTTRIGSTGALQFTANNQRAPSTGPALVHVSLAVTPYHKWPVLVGQAFALVVRVDSPGYVNNNGGNSITPQAADPRAVGQGPFRSLSLASQVSAAAAWRALPGGLVGALQLTGNSTNVVADTTGGGSAVQRTQRATSPICTNVRVRGGAPVQLQQVTLLTDNHGKSGGIPSQTTGLTSMSMYLIDPDTLYPTSTRVPGYPDITADAQAVDSSAHSEDAQVWRVDGSGNVGSAWPPLQPGVTYAMCWALGAANVKETMDTSYGAFSPSSPASRSCNNIVLDHFWFYNSGFRPYDQQGLAFSVIMTSAAPTALAPQLAINATVRPAIAGSPVADPTGASDGVGVFFGGASGARVAVTLTADQTAASALLGFSVLVSAPTPGVYTLQLALWTTSPMSGLPSAPLLPFTPLSAVLRVAPSNASVPQLVSFSGTALDAFPPLQPGQRASLVLSATSWAGDALLPALRWHFSATGSGTQNASANAAALASAGLLAYVESGFAVQPSSSAAFASAAWSNGASVFQEEAYVGLAPALSVVTSGRQTVYADNTGGGVASQALTAPPQQVGPSLTAPLAVVFTVDPSSVARINTATIYVSAATSGTFSVTAALWACAASDGPLMPLPSAMIAQIGSSNAVTASVVVSAAQAAAGLAVPVVFDVHFAWPLVRGSGGNGPPLAVVVTAATPDSAAALRWVLSEPGAMNPGTFVIRGFAGLAGGVWAPSGGFVVSGGATGLLTLIGDPLAAELPLLLDTAYGNMAFVAGAAAGIPIGTYLNTLVNPQVYVNSQTSMVFTFPACSTLLASFVVNSFTLLATGTALATANGAARWGATLWLCDPRSLAPTTMLSYTTIQYDTRVNGWASASDSTPFAVSFYVRDNGAWPLLRPGTTYAISISCAANSVATTTGGCGLSWAAASPALASIAATPWTGAGSGPPRLILNGVSQMSAQGSWSSPIMSGVGAMTVQGSVFAPVMDSTNLGMSFVPQTSYYSSLGRFCSVVQSNSPAPMQIETVVFLIKQATAPFDNIPIFMQYTSLELWAADAATLRPVGTAPIGAGVPPRVSGLPQQNTEGSPIFFDAPQSWPTLVSNASASYALCLRSPTGGPQIFVAQAQSLSSAGSTSLQQVSAWFYTYGSAMGLPATTPATNNVVQLKNGWAIMATARLAPQQQVASAPLGGNATAPGAPPIGSGAAFVIASDPLRATALSSVTISATVSRPAQYSFSLSLALVNASTNLPGAALSTAPMQTRTAYYGPAFVRKALNITFVLPPNMWPPLAAGGLYALLVTFSASDPVGVGSLLFPRAFNASALGAAALSLGALRVAGFARRPSPSSGWVYTAGALAAPSLVLVSTASYVPYLDSTNGSTAASTAGTVRVGPSSWPGGAPGCGPVAVAFQASEMYSLRVSLMQTLVSSSSPGWFALTATLWSADYSTQRPSTPVLLALAQTTAFYVSPFQLGVPQLVSFSLLGAGAWPALHSGTYSFVINSSAFAYLRPLPRKARWHGRNLTHTFLPLSLSSPLAPRRRRHELLVDVDPGRAPGRGASAPEQRGALLAARLHGRPAVV